MISPGKYRAIACSVPQLAESTKKGTPYVAVDFRILGGEYDGEVMEWAGWLNSDKNEERTMKSLKAAGWKGDNITDIGPLEQEVSVTVGHEEDDNGKVRAKLLWVNAPAKKLDSSKAKALAERLKAKAAAMPNVAPVASAPDADDPFA